MKTLKIHDFTVSDELREDKETEVMAKTRDHPGREGLKGLRIYHSHNSNSDLQSDNAVAQVLERIFILISMKEVDESSY
jgi:hypothetical protein